MQAYQLLITAAFGGWCCLIAAWIETTFSHPGRKRLVVPGSPGRVRHSQLYPRSRRRRRQ